MKKVFFIILVVAVGKVYAQDQVPAKLTFKEAVKIGLQNNVLLNQQKNQLEYTQINKTSSMLQLGPTVQAQGSAYRNDGNSFNNQTGEVVNGVIDFVNGSINASMPVFSGMNTLNLYRQAASLNEAQLHFVNRSTQDVIQLVSAQYLVCMLDQELIKINQENVNTQKVQYDQIKEQVNLGSKAEADLANQEYQWRNAELVLVRSRNTFKNDRSTLALTIQVDPSLPFELEPINWDINAVLADSMILDELYATAMDRRSDLKQTENSEKAAHFNYSANKGLYYPTIYAGASYGSRYNYVHGAPNRSFSDQFTQDNTQLSYGFSLTIPIYGGLAVRSQTAFSKVSYENAKLRHKNMEVTIKSDVIRVYQNFNDAKSAYFAAQAQRNAAQISYNMEKERYDLGISDIVQLTTSNQAHVNAQATYQGALYTLMFQRLLIQYAIGTLKFEDIP